MKILINGATAGTNFGDYLFAEMYQNYIACKIGKENVFWYDSRFSYSNFFKNNLKNENKFDLKNIDAFLYMPGGYFCGQNSKLKNYLMVYLMYFRIGLKCLRKKIPYAILGMEISHSKNKIIERIQKKLLVNAKVVSVRNIESYEVAKSYGVKNLFCGADNVFSLDKSMFENITIPSELIDNKCKKIFFHINLKPDSNVEIQEKILPALNSFLENHPEYSVVVSGDQYYPSFKEELNSIANQVKSKNVIKYYYDNPIGLCKVIDCCDLIVTTKLHVGIVGARLSKSVISFSGHTEKIERLYKQLGEEGRTTPLNTLTIDKALLMLNKFHDTPIVVDNKIMDLANMHFSLLDEFLDKIQNENGK